MSRRSDNNHPSAKKWNEEQSRKAGINRIFVLQIYDTTITVGKYWGSTLQVRNINTKNYCQRRWIYYKLTIFRVNNKKLMELYVYKRLEKQPLWEYPALMEKCRSKSFNGNIYVHLTITRINELKNHWHVYLLYSWEKITERNTSKYRYNIWWSLQWSSIDPGEGWAM